MRKIYLACVALLAASLGASPASAQCVFCADLNQPPNLGGLACFHADSGYCYCRVTSNGRTSVCLSTGICGDEAFDNCDTESPLFAAQLPPQKRLLTANQPVVVDATALARLSEVDSLLGSLLLAATERQPSGQLVLPLAPHIEGLLKTPALTYRSSAVLQAGGHQDVGFRFTLVAKTDLSMTVYTGSFADAAREVRYAMERVDRGGRPIGRIAARVWRLDSAQSAGETPFVAAAPWPTVDVDQAAIASFAAHEDLLGELLRRSTAASGGTALSLEPWVEATFAHTHTSYHVSAVFMPRGQGRTQFHVALVDDDDRTTLTYSGHLDDMGRSIVYSTSHRDEAGKDLGHSSAVSWRMDH